MTAHDFDLTALYQALDAKRASLGMSWAAVTREINAAFRDVPGHRSIATSTITGLSTRTVAEADGVLQMLLWLGESPERFVPGTTAFKVGRLRRLGTHQILRWDTRAIHEALNQKRLAQGLSWADVARQIGGSGLSAATLTGLSRGGRTSFPQVMRITGWLGRPGAHFTRASDW